MKCKPREIPRTLTKHTTAGRCRGVETEIPHKEPAHVIGGRGQLEKEREKKKKILKRA